MTVSNNLNSTSNTTTSNSVNSTTSASETTTENAASENQSTLAAKIEVPYQRFIDQLNQDYRDRVSLSSSSQQLQKISNEFFSSTLRSEQIPELTARLYEQGFLSQSEFRQLGGNESQVSAITHSVRFISDQISAEQAAGNDDAVAKLEQVLKALNSMDLPSTEQRRRDEQEAYEYIAGRVDELSEQGAYSKEQHELLDGLKDTLKVLEALDSARKTEAATGAITSYASVQQAHDDQQS